MGNSKKYVLRKEKDASPLHCCAFGSCRCYGNPYDCFLIHADEQRFARPDGQRRCGHQGWSQPHLHHVVDFLPLNHRYLRNWILLALLQEPLHYLHLRCTSPTKIDEYMCSDSCPCPPVATENQWRDDSTIPRGFNFEGAGQEGYNYFYTYAACI